MAKIKAPNADGETIEIEGKVCFLYVGEKRYKFLLQKTSHSEVFLTHYHSGYKVGSLTPIHLRSVIYTKTLSDRDAAKELIESLVIKHGVQRIVDTIERAPKIN